MPVPAATYYDRKKCKPMNVLLLKGSFYVQFVNVKDPNIIATSPESCRARILYYYVLVLLLRARASHMKLRWTAKMDRR